MKWQCRASAVEHELSLWGILGESSKGRLGEPQGRNCTFYLSQENRSEFGHFSLGGVPTKVAVNFLDDTCPPGHGGNEQAWLQALPFRPFKLMRLPGPFRERSLPYPKERKENGNKV